MHLATVRAKAKKLMMIHGLFGWSFKFDRSLTRFGACHWNKKIISMSKFLCRMNEEARVTNTILHEIAHALAGAANGHNDIWKFKALSIGCTAERCYSENNTNVVPAKWQAHCPKCNKDSKRYHRRRNLFHRACGTKLIYREVK